MDALLTHGTAWIVSLCLALLLTGLVAGTLAGLLGIGGGIVIGMQYSCSCLTMCIFM